MLRAPRGTVLWERRDWGGGAVVNRVKTWRWVYLEEKREHIADRES